MTQDLIEQLLEKDLWLLRALALAYYRADQSEEEWKPAECIGSAAYALVHASNKMGTPLVWLNHELRAPMLFLDCAALLHAMGDDHHYPDRPVKPILLDRVPTNFQEFWVHFVDASYGSPSK